MSMTITETVVVSENREEEQSSKVSSMGVGYRLSDGMEVSYEKEKIVHKEGNSLDIEESVKVEEEVQIDSGDYKSSESVDMHIDEQEQNEELLKGNNQDEESMDVDDDDGKFNGLMIGMLQAHRWR